MTIALIGHAAAAGGNANSATTGTFDSTGASLLVACVASYALSAAPVLTGSYSNTWAALTAYLTTSRCRVQLYYVKNPTAVGAGHFVQVNGTSSFPGVAFAAFNDTNTSANADRQNGAFNDSSLTISPGGITPSEGNELIISGLGHEGAFSSIGSGFTLLDSGPGGGFTASLAYAVQTTAAPVNPLWTQLTGGATDAVAAAIASFKSAGGGGGGPVIDQSAFFAMM